jgi:predicted dehydrogenase
MAAPVVRLGLVGAGRWGRNYIRTVAGLDGAVLAAVASGNPQTAALVPPQCRVVADWRILVAMTEIDGVIIATPPALHAEILIAAADAGKAVLVEKPLVPARQQLAAIIDACAHTSRTVMVEHTHLFHPAFRALKAAAAAEKFGALLAIRSSAGAKGPYRHDVSVLWDWAPHDVAMALDLVPGPAAVVDAVRSARQEIDGVAAERLHLTLKLSNGAGCRMALSTLDERHRWFAADFADGTLIYTDRSDQPLRLMRHGAGPDEAGEALPVASELPLTVAVREFVQAVMAGDPTRDSFALGCAVVDVIDRCEEIMRDAS